MKHTNTDGAGSAIDFYFDFISPYGWIGAERIGSLARRFQRGVNWHPFLLKVTVVDKMGLPPLLDTPLKGDYVRRDLPRSLRYHGLGLAEDPIFNFSSVAAARATLWVRNVAPQKTEALVLSLYRAHWSDRRNISEAETVLDIVAELDLPREDAGAALQSDAIRTALREEIASAVTAGVFGSPTSIVDGEMFWGSDRLDMMEKWLETAGW